MREEALYLWQHSGFPAFLNRALKALITEAPHRALRTALQTSQNCLRELRQEIPLRHETWREGWRDFEAARGVMSPTLLASRDVMREE